MDDTPIDINSFTNRQKRDFFHFVGHGLHSVQQGAARLSYKDLWVCASNIEDTNGGPIKKDTLLTVEDKESGIKHNAVRWDVIQHL